MIQYTCIFYIRINIHVYDITSVEKVAQILIECSQGRKQSEISDIMGWKEGATGTAIRRLVDKGLLEKIERGIYQTTQKGKHYITEYMKDYEDQESRRIDYIIYNAYRFPDNVLSSSIPYVSMYKAIIDLIHIDRKTKAILLSIKKIYTGSVETHLRDELVMVSIWADHNESVCDCHKFNYKKSYDVNASEAVRKTFNREELFTSLHRYSRINLSLKRYWTKK